MLRSWLRRLWLCIDLLAIALAVYVAAETTPLGGDLADRARVALHLAPRSRSIASYFDTRHPDPTRGRPELLAALPAADSPEALRAKSAGLRPALARALTVVTSAGGAEGLGRLPPGAPAALARAQVPLPRPGADPSEVEAALFTAVARLSPALGGEEIAVAALVVDPRILEAAGRVGGAERWEELRRQLPARARREADSLVGAVFALATAYEIVSPLPPPTRVTSPFGSRASPTTGLPQHHPGVELSAAVDTPIFAVSGGTVRYVAEDSVNGKFIKIDHGHGLTTAYCHASAIAVKKGDPVRQGQEVARSGQSGRVTGPHLHFQLELDGTPIDPGLFLLRPEVVGDGRGPPGRYPQIADDGARAAGAAVLE